MKDIWLIAIVALVLWWVLFRYSTKEKYDANCVSRFFNMCIGNRREQDEPGITQACLKYAYGVCK
jgi:hypothetical protein